ncbi:MAG: ABC transporter substrate-binding protein [Actinomycetota bacterium]
MDVKYRRAGVIFIAMLALATACSKKENGVPGATSSGGCPATAAVNAFGASCDSTIAAEVPATMQGKVLSVATDASYAPMESFAKDNKTIVGADVDFGDAIATIMGVKFTFINTSFDGIIAGVSAGKYDLSMSSFTDTADREKKVDMVTYFQAGEAIFVAATSTASYKTLDQLCGKPVSVEKGTVELDDIKAQNKKCKSPIKALAFPDQNGANLAVLSGRAVACLADTPVADYQVKVTRGKVKVTGEYVSPSPYGIVIERASGVAPGNAPLTKAIHDAVQKMIDSGVYGKILAKYGIVAGAITTSKINGAAG